MSEKLKPCPFCGGTAKPRVNLANAQPVMCCRRCGSWTYFDETEKIKDGEKAAEAMIKAWNRRGEQAGWIKTSERLPEEMRGKYFSKTYRPSYNVLVVSPRTWGVGRNALQLRT